jgi:predicted flap endonuclease-1-like 5' DNA nuclease
MSEIDYRAKARAVRAEAQAKLRELRARRDASPPRMAARAGARESAGEDGGLAPADSATCAEVAPSADPGADAPPQPWFATESANVAAPAAGRDDADPSADDGSGDFSEVDVSTAAAEMALRAGGAPPAPEHAAPPPEPDDLDAVPGLGPGLLWALREAGVRNVAGLCAADPEALALRLGVVGRLIDVAGLQTLAEGIGGRSAFGVGGGSAFGVSAGSAR